jgi:hemolysin-activating ACP:hemolysin acyltransferase
MTDVDDPKSGLQAESENATVQTCRVDDPFMAIGAACRLMADVQPYAGLVFGEFVKTISGQVRRGHYLFARRDRQILGYTGWALCEEDVAKKWILGQGAPDSDACQDGPVFVLVTLAATEKIATGSLIRACRKLYPGRRAMFHRMYADGRSARANSVLNRASLGT